MPMFFNKKKIPYLDLMGDVGTIGLHLVGSTFIGLAMGHYLDKWLGTGPWLTMIFLLLGIVSGFRHVFRESKRMQERESRKREDAHRDEPGD